MSETELAKEIIEKVHDLKIILSRDLIATDAKWTLFVSAALSYRYDTQLKPFPLKYVDEHGYNIDELISVINEVPSFKVILNNIIEENYDELDTEVIDLLHWVLISEKEPSLRTLRNEELNFVLPKILDTNSTIIPSYIFEVVYPLEDFNNKGKFHMDTENFKIQCAYRGNKLDDFHSILKYGIFHDLCKNGFVYLSTDLYDSLNYSPSEAAWGASSCGSVISCVGVCDYINDPDYIKYSEKPDKDKNKDKPDHFFQITNNENVRLRYLLFFGGQNQLNNKKNIAFRWIKKNKYIITVCIYTLFLASIGIANSGNGHFLRYLISKKSNDIMNSLKKLIAD